MPFWLKEGLFGKNEGEACPAGLGRWKDALRGLVGSG